MNHPQLNVLLVDDDEVFARVFANELERIGVRVHQGYGADVPTLLHKHGIDVAILDIVMPGVNGLDLLDMIRRDWPGVDVIMLTGNATVENALASMKKGAYDYFTKPVELKRVEAVLRRCREQRVLKSRNQMLKHRVSDLRDGHLVGESEAVRAIGGLIRRFADSDSTVLIYGESGTGKELVANLLHKNSPRRDEPFIVVDCAALKESLLESELFGHERGAFTGAIARKHGIFEIADGGTIFLDEIGEVSPALQVKLLRVVETRGFRRVGGNERINVNVRLMAATHRDLVEMVQRGEFREDLYYRINVVNITLPPLRQHREDIPLLVDHFLAEFGHATGAKRFTAAALEALKRYDWPGNIRELRNIVERAVLLAEGDVIDAADVPIAGSPLRAVLDTFDREHYPSLRELEDRYMEWVLEKTGGNKQLAARILRVDRKTIQRRLGHPESGE